MRHPNPDESEASESSRFDFSYFDDPTGDGYRGYHRDGNGDGNYLPWISARNFCVDRHVRSAADWGCAKGFLVAELIAVGVNAVGYDVSEYALSFAQDLPCSLADIRNGTHEKVDATFVLGVLLYLEEAELPAVLINLRAHTDRYLLVSGYYEGEDQDVSDPLRRITRSRTWWRTEIEKAGFRFDEEGEAFDVYST